MKPNPGSQIKPYPGRTVDVKSFMKAMHGHRTQSDDDIQRQAQDLSHKLFANHRELRAILERHEATIQRRWIKKRKTQRLDILLAAWPNMATMHRPDIDACRKAARQNANPSNTWISQEHREASFVNSLSQCRESFIWPYINQEDLSKPKTLPLLLNARGRHDPCDFASADGAAMRLGVSHRVFRLECLLQYVMILNGAYSPDEYGKLLAFREDRNAMGWFLDGRQFSPAKGLIILEAQERVLGFLVSCCKQIMHEIPEHTLMSDAFPIKPTPELQTEADTGGFHSLAIMAAEAPYRVPAHLDFGRIESLLAAQASAAEDHMWSLREDPGYFADMQRELKDHRQEFIRDTNGKLHPALDKSCIHKFWGHILSSLLGEAYVPLEIFSHLQRQAHDLRALHERLAPTISPLGTLPKEYLQAILRFRYYLRQVVQEFGGYLMYRTTGSPPLRRLFVRGPSVDTSSKFAITTIQDINIDNIENELLWNLSTMWEKNEDLLYARLPIVVDEMQRLLDSEPKAKELVSPYIAGIISKISIISQCLTQLDLYQPWSSGFDLAMEEYKDDIEHDFVKMVSQREDICEAIQERNLGQAKELGNPSGGRFAYPVDKRRTRENTETLRQSEANLDAFWAKIDKLVHSKAGDLTGTAVGRLLSQSRIMQRTPPWMEPSKGPSKAELVSKNEQDVRKLYQPLSTLYFGLAPDEPDVPNRTLAKTKKKTRGTAKVLDITATADSHNALEDPNPHDPQPTISVNARALKVFRTLFFNPSPTATPGEVSWTDFLYAMTSTGFSAEKLYGSVWQFRPTQLDVDRSIQFHEPHPHGKIPFQVARRHGRRLNRAYGWFGGMFKLTEK